MLQIAHAFQLLVYVCMHGSHLSTGLHGAITEDQKTTVLTSFNLKKRWSGNIENTVQVGVNVLDFFYFHTYIHTIVIIVC